MHRTEPRLAATAVALAALAGFVDALAFTSMGGFFASFMSGNSTRLGVSLASGAGGVAAIAASLLLSFVSGVILASVIVRAAAGRERLMVMTAVTVLLAAAALVAIVAPGPIVLLLLAAAMGAENGVFQRDGEVTIGVTYLTGSLVKLGQKLAGALMGDAARWAWVPYLLLWLGFAAGVVLGALAQANWGWAALWMAAGLSAALTVLVGRVSRPVAVAAGPWD